MWLHIRIGDCSVMFEWISNYLVRFHTCNRKCCSSVLSLTLIFSKPDQFFGTSSMFFWTDTKYVSRRSIWFSFVFVVVSKQKKVFLAPSIFSSSSLFSSSPLYLPSPTIPSLLSPTSQPLFFLPRCLHYLVSLERQTFGFPLDSCPDALPVSHGDLNASSPIFLIAYTHY